jgi:hypothetical protein
MCNPRHTGCENRRIVVQAALGQKFRNFFEKQLKQKELRGMA